MLKKADGYGIVNFNGGGYGNTDDLLKLWDTAEDLGDWTIKTSDDNLASKLRSHGYLQGYSGQYTITERGRKEIINAIMFEDHSMEKVSNSNSLKQALPLISGNFMRAANQVIDSKPAKLKPIIVASGPESWEKGLMHHRPLEGSECALFIFASEDTYSFWNNNVSFPIDLTYYGNKGNYLGFGALEAYQQKSIKSAGSTKYVIEAKRGSAGITGDRNLWDIIDLDSL